MSGPKRMLVLAAAFMSGASVMAYELVGSRLVAPYFGTSTTVWAALIGTVLAALSAGYWLGGRMADGGTGTKGFGLALLASGLLVLLTAGLDEPVLVFLAGQSPSPLLPLLGAMMLFAPAGLAFGLVSPWATRLCMEDPERAGRDVGLVSSVSTAGSILGTLAAGYLLIPYLGSERILLAIALVQGTLGLVFLAQRWLVAVGGLLLAVALAWAAFPSAPNAAVVHDQDSTYGRLQVVRMDTAEGRPFLALTDAAGSAQSGSYEDSDEPVFPYAKALRLLEPALPGTGRVLIIGGGAMSVPGDLGRRMPSTQFDVVEIDPALEPLAERYFRWRPRDNVRLVHGDGRVFLNANRTPYDAVVLDAYRSEDTVPFHLTTREALVRVRESLAPGGLAVANLLAEPGNPYLDRVLATWEDVFPAVRAYHTTDNPQGLDNLVLVASPEAGGLPADLPEPYAGWAGPVADVHGAGEPLTDDFAPVERLLGH